MEGTSTAGAVAAAAAAASASAGSGSRPIVYLTRVEKYCAAHRLHSRLLSDEENAATFGKCNSKYGHGHNYKVEVTVKGPVDPVTGMVIDALHLRTIIENAVLNHIDHKHLDQDVPHFSNVVSTMENQAVWVWDCLSRELPAGFLHKVKVSESDSDVATYRGERSCLSS